MPQMAESISEGTLKTWQKKIGDTVAADEEVATIETDKVSIVPQTSPMTSVHFLLPSTLDAGCSESYFFDFDSLIFVLVPSVGKRREP